VAIKVRKVVSEQLAVPLHAVVLLKPTSLPRTPSGKVQRFLARKRYLET
jgi:acyl-CoA synthetase (AMP-forming)/AMP-acid ligase II